MDEHVLRRALEQRADEGGEPHFDFVGLMHKCARADRMVALKRFTAAGTALAVAVAIGLSVRGPSADGTVGVETAGGGGIESPVPTKVTTTTEKTTAVAPTTVAKAPVTTVAKEAVPTTVVQKSAPPVEKPPSTHAPKPTTPPATDKPKDTTPTTKKPPAVVIAFTAHATFGECAEPVPYDDYYGTANPGSKVKVESPYGSGYTYADGAGNWALRVEFPSAPVGEPFFVKVWNEQGIVKLQFVRTA